MGGGTTAKEAQKVPRLGAMNPRRGWLSWETKCLLGLDTTAKEAMK